MKKAKICGICELIFIPKDNARCPARETSAKHICFYTLKREVSKMFFNIGRRD